MEQFSEAGTVRPAMPATTVQAFQVYKADHGGS